MVTDTTAIADRAVRRHTAAARRAYGVARRRRGLPRSVRLALLLGPALTVVGVFFVGGVTQAVAQSLGYQPFLPHHRLSLDAYRAMWHDPAVRSSLLLTARVSVVATVTAAVLGVSAALLLRRLASGRRWAVGVFAVNLAVPHLVGALSMLLLLSQAGLLARLGHVVGLVATPADFPAVTGDRFGWGVVAEYVWKEAPFIGAVALASLGRGADELERAAATLGAGPWQRLQHVTLPVLAPPVAAASVLVFAFAVGSYEVPYLLGRPYPATLPVVALQYYRDTDLSARPEAMAVAVLITVLSGAMVAVYLAAMGRLSRRAL